MQASESEAMQQKASTRFLFRFAFYACLEAIAVLALNPQVSSVLVEQAKPTADMSIYGHVARVGWVVKDLDRVLDYWESLGLRNIRSRVEKFSDVTYKGRKTHLSLKMASGEIGDVQVEWIQPIDGSSLYDEFLRKHADGVLSLGYAVASPAQFSEQIRYFESHGVGIIQQISWRGSKGTGLLAYMDTAAGGGGLTMELIYDPDLPLARSAGQHPNEYPFNKIAHYAFVVHDVDKVEKFYERLGFGGMPVKDNLSGDRIYQGKAGEFRERLGFWQHGDRPFEWIQPLAGPSVEEEYLKAHSGGFHHLAFDVTDMDAAIKLLGDKGVRVSQSGSWNEPRSQGRWAYFNTENYGGVTIELIWRKPP